MKPWFMLLVLVVVGCSSSAHSGARLAPCPGSPNCVNSAAPDQNIMALPGGAESWNKLRNAIICLGGRIAEEQNGYLHATFASRIFGFIDDLECLDAGTVIHVRSAARSGWWDFGVNRRRVERLREILGTGTGCP